MKITRTKIQSMAHTVVLLLSLGLILFISYDTFAGIPFLSDSVYMSFQFWVCMVFLVEFFLELYLAKNRWKYFRRYFLFFLVSIPYLNILMHTDIAVGPEALYYLRFIPLIRAAVALAIVISFVSSSKIVGLFATYMSIMLLVVYFASLIFFEREHPVNSQITDYWMSLWWCCLETTTIGAPINPVTPTGKILAAVLSGMGMIMFPLFTVYLTDTVRKYMKAPKTQNAPTPTAS